MKKARSHRKGRASGGESRRPANISSNRSSRSSEVARPLQRNASSSSSQNSQPSQRVDLVVEDHEAEEDRKLEDHNRAMEHSLAADRRHATDLAMETDRIPLAVHAGARRLEMESELATVPELPVV